MGPEMRFWYLVTVEWAQVQGFWESPKYPQGQGYLQLDKFFMRNEGRKVCCEGKVVYHLT
jgi:hypothetical protein